MFRGHRYFGNRSVTAIFAAIVGLTALALPNSFGTGPSAARDTSTREAASSTRGENLTRRENKRHGSPDWINSKAKRRIEKEQAQGFRDISGIGGLPTTGVANIVPTVQGYANRQSVNTGETIGFSVSSTVATYDLVVYRIGWYGGAGAAEITRRSALPGTKHPTPAADAYGTIACNWPVAASFSTSGWVSGYYLAAFVGSGANSVVGYAPFVVRNDSSTSGLLVQIPFNTYQAYNAFGGKSLYDDNSVGGRSRKVSFDRPYSYGQGAMYLFGGDYQMIRFLEKNGFDVSYAASFDQHANAGLMANHRAFLTAFHDEYWTYEMRQNLVNNIAAGKSALFFSANNLFWQVRYEASALGVPGRVMVGYKALDDPYNVNGSPLQNRTSYLFRLPPINLPEEQILGERYEDYFATGGSADWVVTNGNHWAYANTGLVNGSHVPGLVGYEWDRAYAPPADATVLSASPVSERGISFLQNSVLRETASGAIVFDAAVTSFARFLDNGTPSIEKMASNIIVRASGPAGPPPTTSTTAATTTAATTTIPSGSTARMEFEACSLSTGTSVWSTAGTSGGQVVFGNGPSVTYTATCSVNAAVAGPTNIRVAYSGNGSYTRLLWVNGVSSLVTWPTTGGNSLFKVANVPVTLKAGANQIKFDLSYVAFDYLETISDNQTPTTTPSETTVATTATTTTAATTTAPPTTTPPTTTTGAPTTTAAPTTTTGATTTTTAAPTTTTGATTTMPPGSTSRIEFEACSLTSGTSIWSTGGTSGGQVIFGNGPSVTYTATCTINAATAGSANIRVAYSGNGSYTRFLWVNGVSSLVAWPTTGGKSLFNVANVPVTLKAGVNQIQFDLSYVAFDYLETTA
jgi:hypothetical protein